MAPDRPLIPNIIFDCIAIGFSLIVICETSLFIVWIVISRQLTKSKEKILFLLSLNMYTSILVFALLFLDMFISMLKGHMHPDTSHINNGLLWCRLKAYLSNVTLICSLYSSTFQALHRFCRIIHYHNPVFYRNVYLYLVGVGLQVFLSILQPLPLLLISEYQYDDYHCQVQFTNWSGMIIAALLVWLLPVSLTVIIYAYTMHYIRHYSLSFTYRQQTRIKRDVTVIKRILWLTTFMLILGIPACSAAIVYYLSGYVAWWENHVIWSAFILSFVGISTVQTCYSPHMRALWANSRRRVGPTIG